MLAFEPGPLGAAVLAAGGFVCVVGAVLIGIRNVKSKGRKAAIAEADSVEELLNECREGRITDAAALYKLRQLAAERGIEEPP